MLQKKLITLALAASLTPLAGCISSDDDPKDAGALPITFTANNAESTLQQAISDVDISSFDQFSAPTAVEVSQLAPGVAFNALENKLANIQASLDVSNLGNIASGAALLPSGSCSNGGSWTASGSTVNILGCVEGDITINGTIDYAKTENGTAYTKAVSGQVGFTKNGFTLTLKNLNYYQSGDTADGSYTIDPFSFTLNLLINGYDFTTPTPITGISGSCPTAGAHMLTGAGGTQARATYTAGNVLIEVNTGSGFTEVSTVACTGWY